MRAIAGHDVEPQEAAVRFKEAYDFLYGQQGPEWQESSWEESSRQAHQQLKFLFIYLHAPNHKVGLPMEHNVCCRM